MITFIIYFLAVAVLGLIVLLRGRDEHVERNKTVRWLLIAGLIIMGLQAMFYLIFAIGEMAGGDMSGAGHLVPVLAIVLLGLLVWRQPLQGGGLILLAGSFILVFFGLDALIITWPMPVAGILLITGAILGRRTTTHGTGHKV